jgi:hypothetical protein
VTGLFEDPHPLPTTIARPLADRPAGPFQPVDRISTVLYEIEGNTETNLGPGNGGSFNSTSTHMVWLRGPAGETLEAMVIDLRTKVQQSLGPAGSACWKDDTVVALRPPRANGAEGPGTLVDVRTGARTPAESVSCAKRFDITTTPDGLELRQEYSTIDTPVPMSNWYLTDTATGELMLKFEAYQAVPADPGWLVVATIIQVSDTPTELGFSSGTTNIFLVEISTGEATFIATSSWVYANWPLVANERYVAWTNAYCGQPQGTTHIYDRETGEIFDLEQPLWLVAFTDDGRLATDAFGPRSLIDLESMTYDAALPGGEPEWSPDWRYASIGLAGGHGGLCP